MKKFYLTLICSLFLIFLNAQEKQHSHAGSRSIDFPDIPGFKTLVCDFHQHTVFSDGSVWPDIRVQEGLKDGLDAMSVTEHLEYQPHKDDIPHPDRDRSFDLASQEAKDHDLIVIRGSEITRKMPPGHANAIFIENSNKLLDDDVMTVFKEAKAQGGFVFWNHPNWSSQENDGIAKLTEMHTQLITQGLLHGIEVVNEVTYSDEALQIALDNNLTIMGSSDIHGLVDWLFEIPEGGHRPVTLVFAKERTAGSIKEALFEKRTVVYFNDLLIGREEYLKPLLVASLQVVEAKYIGKSSVLSIMLQNTSDVDLLLSNKSNYSFHKRAEYIVVKAHSQTEIQVKTLAKLPVIQLPFEVLNGILAPKQHPVINLQVKITD